MNVRHSTPRVGAPTHIGALLRFVQSRYGITQQEIAEAEARAAAKNAAVGNAEATDAALQDRSRGHQSQLFS